MTENDHCVCVKRNKKYIVIFSLFFDDLFLAVINLEMLEEAQKGCPLFLK